jgi:rare lipoprotein A
MAPRAVPGPGQGRRRWRRAFGLLALIALLASCAGKRTRLPAPYSPRIGKTEKGVASWYGHPYHGRPTASGEIYDMEDLTAAHRAFAFDTWVRVKNLENGRTVEVRINDRGPFVKGRIIDLSKAAAREIDLLRLGVAQVRIQVIKPPKGFAVDRYAVQVGAFRDRDNAERMWRLMQQRFGVAQIVERAGGEARWRVLVGRCQSVSEAEELAARIRAEQAAADAFVTRLD